MIEKIKAKGFEYNSANDVFTGEFNGRQVMIRVTTNNNKVYRVTILDTCANEESQIKIKFNNLYYQFLNNGKYELLYGETLSDSERISYEMVVNKKLYQAAFEPKDKSVKGMVWYQIMENYGSYHICMYYENTMNKANGEDL